MGARVDVVPGVEHVVGVHHDHVARVQGGSNIVLAAVVGMPVRQWVLPGRMALEGVLVQLVIKVVRDRLFPVAEGTPVATGQEELHQRLVLHVMKDRELLQKPEVVVAGRENHVGHLNVGDASQPRSVRHASHLVLLVQDHYSQWVLEGPFLDVAVAVIKRLKFNFLNLKI